MFLASSRYYGLPTAEVTTRDGRTVRVVKVRRLPPTERVPLEVSENDRLDILAQRRYDDPTRFWHIADANTELDARILVRVPGRFIYVPEP